MGMVGGADRTGRLVTGALVLHERYRVEGELASCGNGFVYRVERQSDGRPLALKVIVPEDSDLASGVVNHCRQRLQDEVAVADEVKHENLLRAYEFLPVGGLLYAVLELAAGGTVAEVIAQGPPPIDRAIDIIGGAARGLAALHSKGFVHRDVKPANIFLSGPEPGQGMAMVGDYGAAQWPAHLRDPRREPGFGRTEDAPTHPGTRGYVSPEHRDGGEMLWPTSDVYSLGCVAFELLTGKSWVAARREHDRARDLRVDVPQWLDDVVVRMLAERPGPVRPPSDDQQRRYADMTEVTAALDAGRSGLLPPHLRQHALSLSSRLQLHLICVPAGSFAMGASDGDGEALDYERPQRVIHLDDYWIALHPVTVAQFAAFVEAAGHACDARAIAGATARASHPVTHVSWHDAVAFCDWARSVCGRDVRLPTEAEWEKASRWTDGRRYPWGEDPPTPPMCNFDQSDGGPTPVGAFSPVGDSPYGAQDMAGNVWEWVADWYDSAAYRSPPHPNPVGPAGGTWRVLRGGSWRDGALLVRCSYRFFAAPAFRDDATGFRCVVPDR